MPKGTIYLIQAEGSQRYAIGLTTLPIQEQLQKLNRQSPYPLTLIKQSTVSNADDAISNLHEHFKSDRTHGDWFEFDFLQAQEACQAIKALEASEKSKMSAASASYYLPILLGIAFAALAIALPQCSQYKTPQPPPTTKETVLLLRPKEKRSLYQPNTLVEPIRVQ
jgi:hypothetical protein